MGVIKTIFPRLCLHRLASPPLLDIHRRTGRVKDRKTSSDLRGGDVKANLNLVQLNLGVV